MHHRHRRRLGSLPSVTLALAVAAVLAAPATSQAQWENMRRPAGELERLLQEVPFEIQASRGARAPQDRTRQLTLSFGEGSPILVKMIPAPRGGEDFNNRPHYEAAAYEIQKLFLDPEEYVVPPTVCRCLPVWFYRDLDEDADPTFDESVCVLVTLQSWLWGVTDENVFDRDRFERDTLYARHFANTNVLTYLIEHKDANVGNLLVAEDSTLGRVYAVDNGVSFESQESNRGSEWRRLRVDRIPLSTVERLREVELEDLTDRLAVLVQYEEREGQLALVEPGAPLDANDRVRVEDGVIQLGLTRGEIEGVHARIRDLLERVDEGDLETFGAPVRRDEGE
jgi:hypothetical protein